LEIILKIKQKPPANPEAFVCEHLKAAALIAFDHLAVASHSHSSTCPTKLRLRSPYTCRAKCIALLP
jgi:hypothetical protein